MLMIEADACPVLADCQADIDAYFSDVPAPPAADTPIDVLTFDLESSALDESASDLSVFDHGCASPELA